MLQDSKLQAWAKRVDRRASSRVRAKLKGKLFITGERREMDCIVADLSPDGAGIQCPKAPPRRTSVVLYVAGFGRFEGTTIEPTKGGTGIRFDCTEARRQHIAEQLKMFVKDGLTGVTSLRESVRMPEVAIQNFTRSNGKIVDCEIGDISLTGASLRTRARPPIGEIVSLGRLTGYVVRHHENGIGVQFSDKFGAI